MLLEFEIGELKKPKGHAMVYFRLENELLTEIHHFPLNLFPKNHRGIFVPSGVNYIYKTP